MIEIIAEAGLAHNGYLEKACRMIEAADRAGANTVKFQTFRTDKILRRAHVDYEKVEHCEFTPAEWKIIAKYAERGEIEFLSTPGDADSLKFLVEVLGVKRIKIGSDDNNNWPLLELAAETGLPLLISTGMMTEAEIVTLVYRLSKVKDLSLLHCVSLYPCADQHVNLRAINTIRALSRRRTGYSDHTDDSLACIAAAARGAEIIEKHFYLHDYPSDMDSEVSITNFAFGIMVKAIREVELMLGNGSKDLTFLERQQIPLLRKDKDGLRGLLQ